MERILVTGANGFIGQALVRRIRGIPGFGLLATSGSDCRMKDLAPSRFARMDITSEVQVETVFGEYRPDVVVHSAALSQVDACEQDPELCDRVNIEGTRLVARAAAKAGARFIYLSTDFVFDGLSGPYSEDDQPNPVSAYGWSKLQGEYITRALKVPWAIVRTILVYGAGSPSTRGNLVTWVHDSLSQGRQIKVTDDQFRMPTLVDDLVEGIMRIIMLKKTGIFHLSGPEMISVYDFALKTAGVFNLDAGLITPVKSVDLNQKGRRPPATGFRLDKALLELDYKPVSPGEGLTVVRNLHASSH